jgi:2-enoate reductase
MYSLKRVGKAKKVLVIGGGVAGMEAARVAAVRGHKVALYEKKKNLGGHLIAALVPDFKIDLARLLRWYKTQLTKLEVEIKIETEVSSEHILREKPDVVFVATGSKPIVPDLPGIENPNVVTDIDLLLGKRKSGDTVIVVGGGFIGCEIALWLAKRGKKTTIVEMLPEMREVNLTSAPVMRRMMLLSLLDLYSVSIMTDSKIQEITDEGVIIAERDIKMKEIKADTIVLSLGYKADNVLFETLRGNVAHLYALGDCRDPQNIMNAVWDAYEVTRSV